MRRVTFKNAWSTLASAYSVDTDRPRGPMANIPELGWLGITDVSLATMAGPAEGTYNRNNR